MLRIAVLAILFAAVCAVPLNDELKSAESDVMVVDNIDEYFAQNPDVQFEEMEKVVDRNNRTIRYTFGRRKDGDSRRRNQLINNQYSSPQNVTASFRYPVFGEFGATVTFVLLTVNQTSSLGSARIIFMGIGQRGIGIRIEAQQTLHFNYRREVYGLD